MLSSQRSPSPQPSPDGRGSVLRPAPLISVITPVYNGADYVAECMASVARSRTSKHVTVEHILVDDGSTDGTIAAIERAAACYTYPHRLLRIPHAGKPAHVRNRGIEAARGKYIFCLDHDDALLHNTLQYLAEALEASMQASMTEIVYGDFLRCDGNMSYIVGADYCGRNYADVHEALYSLFKGEHFYQHSFMFSKRLWQQVGGYDEAITFGEDFDLCVRLILGGHIPAHLPITTHLHRNHANSMTACYLDKSVCPVWLAEHRAHYFKHSGALRRYLTTDEIAEIRKTVQITANMQANDPPSRELASALAARTNSLSHIDAEKLCDIA